MINCAISKEQQQALYSIIYGDLLKNPESFSVENYIRGIYSMINAASNNSNMALDYARLVPHYLKIAASRNFDIDDFLLDKVDPKILNNLRREFNDDIKNVEKYITGEKDVLQDLKEIEQEVQNESLSTVKQEEIPEPLPAATPIETSLLLSDNSYETPYKEAEEISPDLKMYSDLKRRIINNVQEDGSAVIPEVGRVWLRVMSTTSIEEKHMTPDTVKLIQQATEKRKAEILDAHNKGAAVFVTRGDGELIYFDKEGKATFSDNGKPAYYTFINPKVDDKGEIIVQNWQKEIIDNISKNQRISKEEARAVFVRQLKTFKAIREYVNKNPKDNSVKLNLTGGYLGRLAKPLGDQKNNLSAFNFKDTIFFPRQGVEAKGEKNNRYYFDFQGVSGVPIERPQFTPDLATKLSSVLFDPLKIETPMGLVNISIPERIQLFKQFVLTGADRIGIFPDNSGTGITLKKFGRKIEGKTQDELKQIVTDYLTRLVPTREITSEQAKGKTIVDNLDNPVLGQVYKHTNDKNAERFFVIEPVRQNIVNDLLKSNEYTDFDIKDGIIKSTKKPYSEYIRNNFFINYPLHLDGDGNLQTLNAYFNFQVSNEEKNKAEGKDIRKEIVEKAKTETPKESGVLAPVTTAQKTVEVMKAMSARDKLIKLKRDNPDKFNKLFGQKTLEATLEQIDEAKNWYEAHPLSSHFPFEQAFNMVNIDNPNSIATWQMNGITLFKGADYSDLYHEAWHGFTQSFLTQDQKSDLYNEVRRKSGSFTDYNGNRVLFSNAKDLQVEEYLAEDFREYMLKGQKSEKGASSRNNIFQKIWNFLKTLFGVNNVSEIALDEKANKTIKDLYEKLRVGDLNDFTFAVENRNYDTLNKGIQRINREEPEASLNYENSKLIFDTVDSLFSEAADIFNSGLTESESLEKASLESKVDKSPAENGRLQELKGQQTYKYASTLFNTVGGLQAAYSHAQLRLAEQRNQLAEKEVTPEIQSKIDLLDYALRNFGDVENISKNKEDAGVIGYHLFKSEFLGEDLRDEIKEDQESENREEEGKNFYDRGGNELSIFDLAAREILYMIKGLHKTDPQGKIEYNKLGLPELVPFRETTAHIARTVQNISTAEKMYDALKKEGESFHPINQLLGKLGPVSYQGQSDAEVDNWTKFWQTFNKYRIPLVQMNMNEVRKDEDGKEIPVRYEVKIGNANADFRKVGQRWEAEFAIVQNNPYIANDERGNYLDTEKLLGKYPDRNSVNGKEFEFFRDMGINLKNTNVVKKALEDAVSKGEIKAQGFYDNLNKLKEKGVTIRNLGIISSSNDKLGIKGEGGNYKKLQELQGRYSDEQSDFMVTNAAGDPQSEFSQNTTLTQFVKKMNEASDWQELMQDPASQHWNFIKSERINAPFNPFTKRSIWINSMFNFAVPGGMRKGPKLNIQNLSGVTLLKDGEAQGEGVISTDADEYTKMILDLHLMVEKGMPELPRHAGKKTSLSVFVGNGGLYVDTDKFIDLDNRNVGMSEAVDMIFPYLKSELERVKECRTLSNSVQQYDFDYLKRGSKLVYFDYLTDELKDQLYGFTGDVDSFFETEDGVELARRAKNQMADYFQKKYEENKSKLKQAQYVSSSLINDVRNTAVKKGVPAKYITDIALIDAIVRSFTLNAWIHNMESTVVLYGDIALYKDFHKRNAAINSTGDVLRTDKEFIDYLNKSKEEGGFGGKMFAATRGVSQENRLYNGILNTAIMEDVEVASVYHDEYNKAIKSPVIDAKYGDKGVNEADAAAFVAFDSYRLFRKSLSKWSNEQERMYQKIVKGESINPSEVTETFPTVKMGYDGPIQNAHLPLVALHKFALFPLIPTVIKGTNLEKLHDKMMREGIDYATFKSGSKVATIVTKDKPDKLYTDNKLRTFNETPFTPNRVFADYLKDQVEVSSKFKKKISFFSQLRKLIDNGLMESGVPTDFKLALDVNQRREDWDKLSEADKVKTSKNYYLRQNFVNKLKELGEVKKRELFHEMGWKMDKNGKPTGDIKPLMEVVSRELSRRDLAEHEIGFIQILPNGKLKHSLDLSQSSDKIEAVLMAIVNKRLVRYKVNGEQLAQVSAAGFENLSFAYGPERKFEKPTAEDLAKYGTNDLPTYHIGSNGKISAAKVKIAIQGDFKKLLGLPEVEQKAFSSGISRREALNDLLKDENWLNTGDNRKMVTMTGARIPTQGINSMEFSEVYEFLPEEAGNIIIAPTEITSKSGTDFDYDKLPMMMPNIAIVNNRIALAKQYTQKEAREMYDTLLKYKINEATLNGLDKNEVFSLMKPGVFFEFEQAMIRLFGDSYMEDLKAIVKEDYKIPEFEEFFERLNGTKAIENQIITAIREILEQPENLGNLIRPNDTDLVKPLADQMKPLVSEFDRKQGAGSHVLEYLYNLAVHQANSVGKDTLGIGAVDNTYNTIFNGVGAYLNPQYKIGNAKQSYRTELLLPHNKLMVKGKPVVSLSGLKDAANENSISEIISQLINGWVDVEKDDWISNIQGNKQLAPIMLYLIQAGVPLKSVVYFISQPLVREYVKQQKLSKSTFAKPLGKAPANPLWYRRKALMSVLENPTFGFDIEKNKDGNITNSTLYKSTLRYAEGIKDFSEKELFDGIKNKTGEYTDREKAAFLHFIEVENITKKLLELKMATNVDTKPTRTLHEAQAKVLQVNKLKGDNAVPGELIDKILNNSAVGAFYTQEFALDLFGKLFPIKNNNEVNEFIASVPFGETLSSLFSTQEQFVEAFRNDLMSYIFQNQVRQFDLDKVDKKQITKDFEDRIYTTEEYEKKGLAKLNDNTFLLAKEYGHFVSERDSLRSLNDEKSVENDFDYINLLNKNTFNPKNKKEGESIQDFEVRIKKLSYEEWLRDKALDNILNPWKLFKSHSSYADQFVRIRKQYPNLIDDYSLMRNLQFKTGPAGYRNLKLSTTKIDADTIEVYHENLQNLSNKSVIKVSDPVANEYISNFFSKFPLVSFMQSGQNIKSAFSLGRIVPQDTFLRIMEQPVKEWIDKISPSVLVDFYDKFLVENANKAQRIRSKDYLSDATLDKPKVLHKGDQLSIFDEENLSESTERKIKMEAEIVKPVTDGDVQDFLNQCNV